MGERDRIAQVKIQQTGKTVIKKRAARGGAYSR